MKYLWQSAFVIGISSIIVGATALAQSMAGPEKSWDRYDLIVKVTIRSIDYQRELQYLNSPEAKAFGYPVEVEMVEPLRMPPGTNELQLLLPAYFVINGRKMPALQMSNGGIAVSNKLAVTCHYFDTPDYLVIADVLSDEMWEVYRQQKEGGASSSMATPELQVDPDKQAQANALLKRISLCSQMRKGEITEDEFIRQKTSLDEVIQNQNALTSTSSSVAQSKLENDPDMQARVNAFQKKTILRGQLENGEITKNEFDIQTPSLDEIIEFPDAYTSMVTPEQVVFPDIRKQVAAFRKSIILRRQFMKGEVTEEEFNRQMDFLYEIMNSPVRNTGSVL